MSGTARLGAFMLVALIIVGIFIIQVEKISLEGRGTRQVVKVSFPSVSGLDRKSAVRIAGVRVGLVEDIVLKGDKAEAILLLDPQISLREGTRAEVRMLGMLGEQYVELVPGPVGGKPLTTDTIVPGFTPMEFDQVMQTAGEVGGDVKEVTASLRRTLGGDAGARRIDEILNNIRQLTGDVRQMVADNRAEVRMTIANFRDFSETLKEELPKLAEKLKSLADRVDTVVAENRENLQGSLSNIREVSSRLRVSADNLNEITAKIAKGEGTIGKLVNEDTTVNNLNATLKSLQSVEGGVQALKDTIGRAQRWQLEVAMKAETLPGIDDGRSSFGVDLHTTDRRFFRAGLVDSPQGRDRTTTEVVTTTHDDGSETAYTVEKRKTSDAYTFNAQVGWLMGETTLRAGVFESKGGVGIDKILGNGKFGVSLEAYDLDRDEKAPHLRLEGRWQINRNLFAFAGWDDPTWSERSSVIVGGGIKWNDEDLKYLLGTMSSLGR